MLAIAEIFVAIVLSLFIYLFYFIFFCGWGVEKG